MKIVYGKHVGEEVKERIALIFRAVKLEEGYTLLVSNVTENHPHHSERQPRSQVEATRSTQKGHSPISHKRQRQK
jgi:hypothetical protein